MNSHRFASDEKLPWVEIRQTQQSRQSYKDHFHPELFVAAITEGETAFSTATTQALASKGSLVILPPGTVHRCTPLNAPRSYIAAFFNSDWCLELQNEHYAPAAELQLPLTPLLSNRDQFLSFLSLVSLLQSPAFTLEKQEAVSSFVLQLFSHHVPVPSVSRKAEPLLVQQLKQHLSQGLSENLSFQQLAKQIGYSQHYLLRSFKKSVGLTPHEYRLNLRIEHAKELLRHKVPPATVAAETGFVDQSHFHRTFKHFVSATPRQFQLRDN